MTLKNISNTIIKLGGTVTIETLNKKGYDGTPWTKTYLKGTLNGYEIEFSEGSNYFTSRKIGTVEDMGSDYNPGGWRFDERVKDLNELLN